MSPSHPGRWSKKLFGRRRKRGPAKGLPRPAFFRPNFESLEDRIAPTVDVWSGASPSSNNWSDPLNWVAKVVPKNGDALVFPGGPAQLATTDDLNLSVSSITFDAANYTVAQGSNGGNPVTISLGAGGFSLNSAASSGSDTFNVPIVLTASTSIVDTYTGVSLQLKSVDTGLSSSGFVLTIGGSGTITAPGGITDGGSLVKAGPGKLTVTSTSTYTGLTTVSAGFLTLAANGNLGSSVTVSSGATLQLAAGAILNQPLTLNGSGVGGGLVNSTAGALEVLGSGFVNGAITLGSDAVIGVDTGGSLTVQLHPVSLAGHTLTVNAAGNAIFTQALNGGVANAGNLVVNTAQTGGTVTLNAASTFTGTTTVAAGTLDLGGATGSLVSNNITVNQRGTLLLDNSSGTSANRIPSLPASSINLNGGTLTLLSGANAVTQNANAIRLLSGQSNIRINQGGTPAMPTVLHAVSLVRSTGATVNFSSNKNNLGTTSAEVVFTTPPATTIVANGSGNLFPYATVGDTDLATYGANGVAAFTGYILNPTTYNPSTDSTDVVEYTTTAALPTLPNGGTINYAGMVINGGATLTIPTGMNLTLANGGLLLNHASIIPGSLLGGNMTFGAEGVIYSNASAGANSISVQITGNRGMDLAGPALNTADLTKYLYLNPGTARNTWTGGTWLDSANVGVAGTNPLGAASTILTIVGGALATATGPGAAAQLSGATLSNTTVLASANTTLNANNLTLSGNIGLVGNSVLTVLQPATLTGVISNSQPANPGGLVELGSSTLTLSPGLGRLSNSYSGSTVVGAGTLALATLGNPLGTGALVLTGTATSATTLQEAIAGISLVNPLILSNPAAASGSANVTITGSNFTFARPVTLTGLTSLQVNAPVTITGAISGTGGLTVSGSGNLVLTGTNNYSGATTLAGGLLTINGTQGNSAVAVQGGTLSGTGTTGFLTVGSAGTLIPSNPVPTPAAKGVLTAPGANFSEGGNLTLRIGGTTAAGTDYSSLNLGSGPLVVGGNGSTAPSTLTLDLTGLSSPGVASGAIVYGSQLGTVPAFNQLNVLNNPNDYAASLDYTPTALNVILTASVNTTADLAPSTTDIWTGASTISNHWSDPANWAADAAPKKNDDLVFPAGAKQLTNVDDLIGGTHINSITIEAGGYTLNPNTASTSIALAQGLTVTEPPDASANPLPTTVTVNIPMNLTGTSVGAASFPTTFVNSNPNTLLVLAGNIVLDNLDPKTPAAVNLVVDGEGETRITGLLSADGGVIKNGLGQLDLWPSSAAGSSYTGQTILKAGITTINNPTSLGDASGLTTEGTFVKAGATLETLGTTGFSLGQQLTLTGSGVGGNAPGTSLGAIDLQNGGTLTLTGGISLLGDATIDNPIPNTQLDITTNNISLGDNGGNGSNLTINTASAGNGFGVIITVAIKGGKNASTVIFNDGMTAGTGTTTAPTLYNGAILLTGASTYSGATVIDGGVVDLAGGGTLLSGDIEIGTNASQNDAGPLAVFEIDDRGTNIARLLGNAPVLTFNGGAFVFEGVNGNNTSKEVIDHIALHKGQSFIQMDHGFDPKNKAIIELDMDHISHSPGATINFGGNDFGSAQYVVLLTNSTTPALDASGQIFPFGTVITNSTTPSNVPTYLTAAPTPGSKPTTYTLGAFQKYQAGNITGNNPTFVGEVASGTILTIAAGTTTTLAALRVDGGGEVFIEPGATLDLQSGLLTAGSGSAYIGEDPAAGPSPDPILTIGGGETASDATVNEGVIMSYTPTSLVAQLTDDVPDSAFTGYTFAGPSTTLLTPPSDGNTYTGDTYVASGVLLLEGGTQPFGDPTISTLHLAGGVLAFDASSSGLNSNSATISNNIAMNGGLAEFAATGLAAGQVMNVVLGDSGTTNTLTLAGGDVLAIPANIDVTINDKVTGKGNLYEVAGGATSGGGVLTLNNTTNDYSGGTVLSPSGLWQPTLLVTNPAVLGTGTLYLVGGTFEANSAMTITNALDLESANITLGGVAPNNGALTFSGNVALTGINNVTTVSTPAAGLVYDNGPINGTINGWTISNGFQVSDSFRLTQPTTLTSAQVGLRVTSGAVPASLQWTISTQPTGGGVANGNAPTGIIASGTATPTNTFQSQVTQAGNTFDIYESTFALNATLPAGTYYLSLGPNSTASGGSSSSPTLYWDENDGASSAYSNIQSPGPIAGSQSFQLYSSGATQTVFSGSISGSGALNDNGTIILSGTTSTQTGFSAATPGPLEIDGSQPSSPVPVTMATLDGNGTAGVLAVGGGGVVEPGTPSAVGELTAGGANFSDNGTLHLRIPNTTVGSYDVLNLSGGTLVIGGTSTLVLDLAGLSGITADTTVTGVIFYGSPPPPPPTPPNPPTPPTIGRIGNVPVFGQVQIINNPNNYAVELDYTTTAGGQPELNLVIGLGAPDVPILSTPAAPATPEDVPLQFGNGNSFGISVADLEGAAPYTAQFQATVSIPASAGTLSLATGSPDAPLTSTLVGTNQVLTFPTGTGSTSLASLNADLAGLIFTPSDDFTGTVPMSLTVTNEGGSALLPGPQSATTTINITVTPTTPAFTVGPNELVAFTAAGPNNFTFSPWATGIKAEPQPASWAGQTSLAFSTSSDNPALFTATGQPTIDPVTGTLTFTLANPLPPLLVAHVKVILSETEPDGDIDSSPAQTFTITATTTAPPTVSDIILHWGTQKASLLYMLNHDGRIDVPFSNINAIDVQFSQSLNGVIGASPLSVVGKYLVNGAFPGSYALSSPVFLNSYTVEWKLPVNALGGTYGNDNITLTVNGNAFTAGGNGLHMTSNFVQGFYVLVGDVTNDGRVDLNDQLKITQNLAISYAGISYLDLVGDGHIDMSSYSIARARFGNVKH
jgi:autotransporter-associated beta strand protein